MPEVRELRRFAPAGAGYRRTVPRLLELYLQDHHAGSTAGLALARRAAGAADGEARRAELQSIAEGVARDRIQLERLMSHVGVTPDRLKEGLATASERLARLKPNHRLVRRSPLSSVIELEALVLGITGKLALWEAVAAALGDRVGDVDLAELARRARDQRERVERIRVDLAESALRGD